MEEYDYHPRPKTDHVGLVLLILFAFIVMVVVVLFFRPQIVDNTVDLSEKAARITELEQETQALKSRMADQQARLDAVQTTIDLKDARIKELEDTISRHEADMKAVDEVKKENEKLKEDKSKQLHASVGVDLMQQVQPFDTFDPILSIDIGAGQGPWQVVTGLGVDLDGDVYGKMGFSWSW